MNLFKKILVLFSIILSMTSHAQSTNETIQVEVVRGNFTPNPYTPQIGGNWSAPNLLNDYDIPGWGWGPQTDPNIPPTGYTTPGGKYVMDWIAKNPSVYLGTQTYYSGPNNTGSSITVPVYDLSKIPMYYAGTYSSGTVYDANGLVNVTKDLYIVNTAYSYTIVDGVPIIPGFNDITPTSPVVGDNTGNNTSNPTTPVTTQDCSNPNASNTTNSSICLIGQVIEGCKLTTGNYYTTINSVAGNVGLTAVDVRITCSTGTPFHIKPIHDHIQLAGDDETLKLTGWKDNGRANKLTPLSAKVIIGTGVEQSIPIYFTLEGKGKSGIYGNSIVNKYTGSAVYPIQIVY